MEIGWIATGQILNKQILTGQTAPDQIAARQFSIGQILTGQTVKKCNCLNMFLLFYVQPSDFSQSNLRSGTSWVDQSWQISRPLLQGAYEYPTTSI